MSDAPLLSPARRFTAILVALACGAGLVVLNGSYIALERRAAAMRVPAETLSQTPARAVSTDKGWVQGESDGSIRLVSRDAVADLDALLHVAPAGDPPLPLSALTADPHGGRTYAAHGGVRIAVFGPALEPLATLDAPHRVFGLAALSNGALAVCHGADGYGPDYFLSIVKDPLTGPVPPGIPLNFATRFVAASGEDAIYATVHGRLGKVNARGAREWETVLFQPPQSLSVARDGRILVGDARGGLALINADGQEVWRRGLSRFGIRQTVFSTDGRFLIAADDRAAAYVCNAAGRLLCALPAADRRNGIAALLVEGDDARILCTTGATEILRLSETEGLGNAATMRTVAYAGNPLIALALLCAITVFSARLSRTARLAFLRIRQGRTAYLLLAPTFAMLLVFCYYPVATAFLYSFMKLSLSAPMEFTGLDNYRKMFHDPYVWVGMKNMFIFLVTGLVKTLTVPLLVAELVFWLANDRLRQAMRTFFVFPAVVPGLISVLLWKLIYSPNIGLLNKILEVMGLESWKHAWLADERLAIWAIVFSGFPWVNVFAFLILLGGLINISRDIHEASAIDGVSIMGRFLRIDVPLIMPQIRLLIVLTFIGSIQDFTSVLVFTGGGPGIATYVPALQMFFQTAEGMNLGYASAIGVFLFALVLAATLLNNRLFRSRED